jgi:uncharacterized iron-regulated membrane protein
MAVSGSAATSRVLFVVHRWSGLTAGIVVLAVCLSGAFAALLHDYETTFEAATVTVVPGKTRLAYDTLFAAARAHVPDFHLYDYARLPQGDDRALEILYFPDGTYRSVFLNPYTGDITGSLAGSWSRWLLKFHWSLGLGDQGRGGATVVFVAALTALMSVVTGAVVYRKRWRDALRVAPALRRGATHTALHRVAGVWSGAFLLVLLASGAYINYFIVTGVFAYPGGDALGRRPVAPLAISVDAAIARAVVKVPGLLPASVSFPQLEGGPVAISGPVAGQNGFLSPHTSVLFDPRTGALLAVRGGPAEAGLVGTLETAVFNLHYAKFGGWPVRVLYALLSLLGAGLPVTGLVIWWRKQAVRRRRSAAAPA